MTKEPTTKYLDIYTDLKSRIARKEFSDARLPSERELAEQYNVNRLTLRKALRNILDEGLIVRLGAKGTFVTDCEMLKKQFNKNEIICLLVGGSLQNSYFGAIVFFLNQELKKHDFNLSVLIVDTPSDLDKYHEVTAITSEIAGIVVCGFTTPDILSRAWTLRRPMVLIGRLTTPDDLERQVDQVAENSFGATYDCMTFLISKGYRRIALVDDIPYQWSITAENAYMKAIEEAGIKYDANLIIKPKNIEKEIDIEPLRKKIIRISPDALFIRSEPIAGKLLWSLLKNDKSIFHNLPIITLGHPEDSVSHLSLPKLESQPEIIAKEAVKSLIRRMALPSLEIQRKLVPLSFRAKSQIPCKNQTNEHKSIR